VPFKSYAYLRVKGSMIDYLRSQKIAVKGGELREFDFFAGLAGEGDERISIERLEFLFESLRHLSPREAEIIRGMYLDGLSQSELAARLNCTRANVSILHGRAVKRLQKLVGDAQRQAGKSGLAWFNPWG
jgi:RNA polymerase sigma factor (sigma-70 family)